MFGPDSRPARRMRQQVAAAAVVLGLCLMPVSAATPGSPPSASPSASPAAAHGPSTFVVGNNVAVDTLNPYVGVTSQDFEVYGLIYDNLMDYGQLNYSPSPRRTSRTPSTATFTARQSGLTTSAISSTSPPLRPPGRTPS